MVDFALEPLTAAQPDIERMLPSHWGFVGDNEVECQPNWPAYHKMDAQGACMVTVARQDGVAVGWLAAFVYPHPNAIGVLKAEIPTYFVKEGPNRALIMSRMIDFALERLAARGVFKIDSYTKMEHSAGRLWELKGFKPDKTVYTLKLKALPEERYA